MRGRKKGFKHSEETKAKMRKPRKVEDKKEEVKDESKGVYNFNRII